MKKSWEEIAAGCDDPFETLRQMGRWYYRQLTDRPDYILTRFRSVPELTDPEVAKVSREGYLELVRFVQGIFEQANARGQISAKADAHAIAWLYMATGSLLDITHLLGLRSEVTLTEVEAIEGVIMKGLKARGDDAPQ